MLQLNQAELKSMINGEGSKKERSRLWLAIFLRAVLIVAFSVALISPLSMLFGSENSSMGVVLLCIILSIRFVDFGYCVRDSLRNLGIVFLLLLFSPSADLFLNPIFSFFVHFFSILLIVLMTSDKPEMGNGGLFAFSYILLAGNAVSGELFIKRAILTLISYGICAIIFFQKHRDKNAQIRYHSIISGFSLKSKKCRWQLQLALGISLLLALGNLLKIQRLMWAGFACASLLGCYSADSHEQGLEIDKAETKNRFWARLAGAILGSAIFAIIYTLVPQKLHFLFGPIGGICLGFCTKYRYKTALNCVGALLLGTALYGLSGSVFLRIINNLIGASFGYGFFVIYNYLANKKLGFAK